MSSTSHWDTYTVNDAAWSPSVTYGERVTETLERRLEAVALLQGQIDALEETHAYVPQYLLDQLQEATDKLQAYAGYWGFDA